MTRLNSTHIPSPSTTSSINNTTLTGHATLDPSMIDISETLASNPELLSSLSQMMMNQTGPSAPTDGIVVNPEPGFVLKTIISKGSTDASLLSGEKVFINVCHSPDIPSPPEATTEEIAAAIAGGDNCAYKVPLSLIGPRPDVDKKGNRCHVFDACVHSSALKKGAKDFDYKLFLIELSLEWVEEKHGLELSRDFSLPKLKCKGKLIPHRIRKRVGIEELKTTKLANEIHQEELEAKCQLKEFAEGFEVLVSLPKLESAQSGTLVLEKSIIHGKWPSHYKFSCSLPSEVNGEINAEFLRSKRLLRVSLLKN